VSKRIDDGTKVGDTGRKHKRHSPFARIRFLFDYRGVRRNRRTRLMAVLFAAQRGIAADRRERLGALTDSLDLVLTRL
jgi:hypothetical protein